MPDFRLFPIENQDASSVVLTSVNDQVSQWPWIQNILYNTVQQLEVDKAQAELRYIEPEGKDEIQQWVFIRAPLPPFRAEVTHGRNYYIQNVGRERYLDMIQNGNVFEDNVVITWGKNDSATFNQVVSLWHNFIAFDELIECSNKVACHASRWFRWFHDDSKPSGIEAYGLSWWK